MRACFLLLLMTPAFAEYNLKDLKCPPDTSLVDYTSQFNKERQLYCQKNLNKKMVRHGPFIVLDKDGKMVQDKVYVEGKVHRDLLAEKAKKNKKPEPKYLTDDETLNFVFQFTFAKAFDFAPHSNKKELTIAQEDTGRCIVKALDRMNFLVHGTKFTERRKFRPNCHIEGNVSYEFKKEIPVELKIKKLLNYNKLKFKLYMTKIKDEKDPFTYHISSWLREGQYLNKESMEELTFEAAISFDVKVKEVAATRGRGGLYITSGHFKAFKLNGREVNFYRERKVQKKN